MRLEAPAGTTTPYGGAHCMCKGDGIVLLVPAGETVQSRHTVVWSWWRSIADRPDATPGDCYIDVHIADVELLPDLKYEEAPCPSCMTPDMAIGRTIMPKRMHVRPATVMASTTLGRGEDEG